MRVLALRTLREYWTNHADAETSLRAWYTAARLASWKTPDDIKAVYANASIIANNRVVVEINYMTSGIYVRFIGTHAEYDKIDAETV